MSKERINTPADNIQHREPQIDSVRAEPNPQACPSCGGNGVSYNTNRLSGTLSRRYYRCRTCKRTWFWDVARVEVRGGGFKELNTGTG